MADAISIKTVPEFQELIASTKYVIVDFWADWCPPCKAIGPIFSKMAKTNSIPGKLAFAKVDLEETPEIPEEHSVASIPAFLFFVDGVPQPLDLQGRIKKGPTVVLDDESGKLKRIQGADPRVLNMVVAELARLAKEAPADSDVKPEKDAAEKKDEAVPPPVASSAPPPATASAEETTATTATASDKKEDANPLFAAEDENW